MRLVLAFVAGAFVWHRAGKRLFGLLGWNEKLRADVLGKLPTEQLMKLRRSAQEEEERRRSALVGQNGGGR
jgi:hypothetical protein